LADFIQDLIIPLKGFIIMRPGMNKYFLSGLWQLSKKGLWRKRQSMLDLLFFDRGLRPLHKIIVIVFSIATLGLNPKIFYSNRGLRPLYP